MIPKVTYNAYAPNVNSMKNSPQNFTSKTNVKPKYINPTGRELLDYANAPIEAAMVDLFNDLHYNFSEGLKNISQLNFDNLVPLFKNAKENGLNLKRVIQAMQKIKRDFSIEQESKVMMYDDLISSLEKAERRGLGLDEVIIVMKDVIPRL